MKKVVLLLLVMLSAFWLASMAEAAEFTIKLANRTGKVIYCIEFKESGTSRYTGYTRYRFDNDEVAEFRMDDAYTEFDLRITYASSTNDDFPSDQKVEYRRIDTEKAKLDVVSLYNKTDDFRYGTGSGSVEPEPGPVTGTKSGGGGGCNAGIFGPLALAAVALTILKKK